jgi:hypothetical protein
VIASRECSETSEQEVFVAMQGVAPDGGTVVA